LTNGSVSCESASAADRRPDDHASWTAVGDDLPRLGGANGFEPVG